MTESLITNVETSPSLLRSVRTYIYKLKREDVYLSW